MPERFANLFLNEREQSEVYEAELVLLLEAPPGFCPVDRFRLEFFKVVLKETFHVFGWNALQKFR